MAAECSVCQTLPNKGKIQQCQNPDDLFGEGTILFRHGKQAKKKKKKKLSLTYIL